MKKNVAFRTIAVVLPFVLFLASVSFAAEPAKGAAPAPLPAYMTQKFSLLSGGETTLKEQFTSENNLLVYFQSACITCATELKSLRDAYANSPKVKVIGVGVDIRPDQLKKFVEELGFPKVVLLDSEWKLGPEMMVSYTPAAVLFDKAGNRVFVFGGFTPKTMETIQSKLK